DAYVDPWYATRPVDLAAATLIVREAGALVSARGKLGETPRLTIDERIALVAAVDGETIEVVLNALRALGSSALSG
ncbi:MAG: hypothetical protein QXO64_05990, partial [Thermofilaceae archaeon]